MNILLKLIVSTLFVLISNCLSASTAWANDQAAIVIVSTGDFYAVNKTDNKRSLKRRAKIFVGDTLVTGPDSRSQVRFIDGAIISLRPNTKLRIDDYRYGNNKANENSVMTLIMGGFRTITGAIGKEHYKVTSSLATIGIRGTHYEAVIQDNQMYVALWHGGVTISNDAGQVDLGLGADYNFAHVQSNTSQPTGLLDAPDVIGNDAQPQITPDVSTTATGPVAVDISPVPLGNPTPWEPVAPTEIMPTTGTANYTANAASISGTSSDGDIQNFAFNANVDFAAATINGNMTFTTATSSAYWSVEFAGTSNGSDMNVTVDTTNSTIDGAEAIDGTISGSFIGNKAEKLSGNFDLHQISDPTVTANGSFTATQ